MADRKTSKEPQRNGTLQSIRAGKTGSKKKAAQDPKRSSSLQSIRGTSTKKKAGTSKGVVQGGKNG
ncbi:MAG: hypothetical protein ACJ74J_03830 [Blastocatellia bacterium]